VQSAQFAARRQEVVQRTEAFRDAWARTYGRRARDARTRIDMLVDATRGEGIDAFARARARACPKCHARPGAPCVNVRSRSPIKKTHPERAGLRELEARAVWNERRANGQVRRGENLCSCGGTVIATRCTATACGHRGRARPVGCGIWRLCSRCSIERAREHRERFGRARGRALLRALERVPGVRGPLAGPAARFRVGGRYTDKMLTLTLPHFDGRAMFEKMVDIEHSGSIADEETAERIRRLLRGPRHDFADARERYDAETAAALDVHDSTVILRIAVLFAAWPTFLRRVRAMLAERGHHDDEHLTFDRFFEWTPGADGLGHPHFHVWLFSPFICADAVRELWTQSLAELGVPMRTHERDCPHCKKTHVVGARVWLQRLGDFNVDAVREMMKEGNAIKLSNVRSWNVGPTAETYAGGWAISDVRDLITPEVEAELYVALEGRRLSQGSKGFYSGEPAPACPCCGALGLTVAEFWSADDIARTQRWNQRRKEEEKEERGPPHVRAARQTDRRRRHPDRADARDRVAHAACSLRA